MDSLCTTRTVDLTAAAFSWRPPGQAHKAGFVKVARALVSLREPLTAHRCVQRHGTHNVDDGKVFEREK